MEDRIATSPLLETPRLILRQPRLEDAVDVFDYARDPEFAFYLGVVSHSVEDAQIFITNVLDRVSRGERISFGMVEKASGRFIGECNFHEIALKHRRAEIGYGMGRAWWGQGLMTEAIRAVMRFGFENLNLHRIGAVCDAENRRSEHVMQRCGMSFEGCMRDFRLARNGFQSYKQYSILKPEWNEMGN